jgi:hypothetical protein
MQSSAISKTAEDGDLQVLGSAMLAEAVRGFLQFLLDVSEPPCYSRLFSIWGWTGFKDRAHRQQGQCPWSLAYTERWEATEVSKAQESLRRAIGSVTEKGWKATRVTKIGLVK